MMIEDENEMTIPEEGEDDEEIDTVDEYCIDYI